MKRLLLLFAVVLLCSFTGKKIYNSLSEYELKGKVRSVTEFVSDTSTRGTHVDTVVYLFDKMGNLLSKKQRGGDFDSLFDGKWSYSYNDRGNKVQENIHNLDGSISWTLFFNYDKAGANIESRRYTADGHMMEKYVYTFDQKGNRIKGVSTNLGGEVNCRALWKYDLGDRVTEDVSYCNFPGADRGQKTVYIRDKNGAVTETRHYEPADSTAPIYYMKYTNVSSDKNGNWLKRIEKQTREGKTVTIVHVREITYY